MLHEAILRELLEDEVAVARERLEERITGLSTDGRNVDCRFTVGGRAYCLRLAGRAYDAEPFKVSVVDDAGQPLQGSGWPPGLYHGQHPVLKVPFACIRGTYEYHVHTSHLGDSWDRYRPKIRLAELLSHLLRRCGR